MKPVGDNRPPSADIANKASLVLLPVGLVLALMSWAMIGRYRESIGPALWAAFTSAALYWYYMRPRPSGVLLGLMVIQSMIALSVIMGADTPVMGVIYMLSLATSIVFLAAPQSYILACLATLILFTVASLGPENLPTPIKPEAWWVLMPSMIGFGLGEVVRRSLRGRQEAEAIAIGQTRINALLAKQLQSADELAGTRERTRIARELHDSLGHCLTAGLLYIEYLERRLPDADDETTTALGRVRGTTEKALTELRRCVALLREDGANKSLADSLRSMAEQFPVEVLDVRVAVNGAERRLEATREFALFRAAQEALTNAAKHAAADAVELQLHYQPERVELVVTDDGVGCAEPSMGYGLQGIRERLESVGGTLAITTSPDRGYTLRASVEP